MTRERFEEIKDRAKAVLMSGKPGTDGPALAGDVASLVFEVEALVSALTSERARADALETARDAVPPTPKEPREFLDRAIGAAQTTSDWLAIIYSVEAYKGKL